MFHAGHTILTILNSIEENGAAKFEENGGKMAPYPDDRGVILYQPRMTDEFKRILSHYNHDEYTIEIVDTINMMQPAELIAFTFTLQDKIPGATVAINPLALYIAIPQEASYNITALVDTIIRTTLPNARRAFIMFTNKYERYSNNPLPLILSDTEQRREPIIESEPMPGRTGCISSDEIINLKIELALCTDSQAFIDSI